MLTDNGSGGGDLRTLRNWVLAAGLIFVPCALAAAAASSSPSLEMAKKRMETADFRAVGRIVRVDADGKRTVYPMTLKGRWMNGALHLICAIAGPPESRMHIRMEVRPDGRNGVEVARPSDKTPSAVPVSKWSDGIVGVLSYDDLMGPQYFWASQSVTGPVPCGARECDLVKSTPGAADRTSYTEVKTWLDRKIGFPVRVEATEKRGGTVKEFTYYGLRQTEGVWSASQVEVKARGQLGETLLVISRGSPHAHLNPKDFSSAAMTRF